MTDHDDIPPLEDLAVQFRRLATETPKARRWFLRRPSVAALAVTLSFTGTAAAAVVVLQQGEPIPEPPAADFAPENRASPGAAGLAETRVPDPAGGPPWGVRLSQSQTGRTCYTPGRIVDGELGVIRSGVFRALPLRGPDKCVELSSKRPLTMDTDEFLAPDEEPRTVINGLATSAVARIELLANGRLVKVRPDSRGAYLAVFEGDPNVVRTVIFVDGRVDVLDPGR